MITIKIDKVSTILLDKEQDSSNNYKFNLLEWVDTGNCISEVSYNKIKILKFKPNVWLFHSPTALAGTNCADLCSYCRGTYINIEGLSANSSMFSNYYTTTTTTGAGGDVGKLRGLCFYPFSTDGLFLTVHLNYWDHKGIGADGTESLPQLPDMVYTGGLRLDGNGRNRYGIIKDCSNKLIFPDELYGFSNTQGWKYYYAFGLFSGDTLTTDENGYVDISGSPIIISLVSQRSNPISVEIWKAYVGNKLLYNKEKTLDNCWIKYGLATKNDDNTITVESDISNVVLPDLITDDNISNILWGSIDIVNTEVYDKVKEYYANNTVEASILRKGVFKNTTMTGELILNITDSDSYATYLPDLLSESSIESIVFNFQGDTKLTSCNNLFRRAYNLKTISSNKSIGAVDVSGMFEFCNSLTEYPEDLIDWEYYGNYMINTLGGTNMGYFVEYSAIENIPGNNTISFLRGCANQVFNTTSLKSVSPILNLSNVVPNKDSTYLIFNCPNCTSMRINGLNHGDWVLDGSGYHGNLSKLDKSSVEYLFDHLYDLTTHVYECTIETINNSFRLWDVGNTPLKYMTQIKVNDYPNNTIVSTTKEVNTTIVVGGTLINDAYINICGNIITSTGTYTITNSAGHKGSISYSKGAGGSDVVLSITGTNGIGSYHTMTPKVSNATLTYPSTWADYITEDMITAANAKGWTIKQGN